MGVILDSSMIIAAERKGRSVLQILEQVEATWGETELGLSVVTIAELTHGAFRAPDEQRKQRRLLFIDRLCNDIPIFPVTLEIARSVGRIEGEQASKGIVLAFEDLAIGVTALYLDYFVATLNLKDFQRIPGLTFVSL